MIYLDAKIEFKKIHYIQKLVDELKVTITDGTNKYDVYLHINSNGDYVPFKIKYYKDGIYLYPSVFKFYDLTLTTYQEVNFQSYIDKWLSEN